MKQKIDLSKATNRDPVISISRVLGMIFIVICHIIKYYTFISGSEFLGQFFNCGVHMFLFISGYLYGMRKITNFKKWYCKRLISGALPAIIVSWLMIIALFIAGENISFNSIIAYSLDIEGLLFLNYSLSKIFSEIAGLGPLWFTTIILLCYLLVPILQKLIAKVKNKVLFLILVFFIGSILFLFVHKYVSIIYFVVFSTGYIAGNIELLNRVNTKFVIVDTIIFLFAIVGRIILHKYIDGTDLYTCYASISHFFIGTWIIVVLAFINNISSNMITKISESKAIKILDKYSFYIYLTHGIFCMSIFSFYEKFSLLPATTLFIVSTLVATVVLKWISTALQKPILKRLYDY